MQTRRQSVGTTRLFLLSGFEEEEERRDLVRKINLLGGKYIDLPEFKALCTHVVCKKLTRSEKFLGACSTGKWVLHPSFIIDSFKANNWLDEEQYEWCDSHIASENPVDLELAYATRRWRFVLGDQKGAFAGWKVAVAVGARRSKVIKRLLISGGAEVYKLPAKHASNVAETITYVFTNETNFASVSYLADYGVMCLKPEYIGDFLVKDPTPDPFEYIVQTPECAINSEIEPRDPARGLLEPWTGLLDVSDVDDSMLSQENFLVSTPRATPSKADDLLSESALTPLKHNLNASLIPKPSTSKAVFHSTQSNTSSPNTLNSAQNRKRPISKLVYDSTDIVAGNQTRPNVSNSAEPAEKKIKTDSSVEMRIADVTKDKSVKSCLSKTPEVLKPSTSSGVDSKLKDVETDTIKCALEETMQTSQQLYNSMVETRTAVSTDTEVNNGDSVSDLVSKTINNSVPDITRPKGVKWPNVEVENTAMDVTECGNGIGEHVMEDGNHLSEDLNPINNEGKGSDKNKTHSDVKLKNSGERGIPSVKTKVIREDWTLDVKDTNDSEQDHVMLPDIAEDCDPVPDLSSTAVRHSENSGCTNTTLPPPAGTSVAGNTQPEGRKSEKQVLQLSMLNNKYPSSTSLFKKNNKVISALQSNSITNYFQPRNSESDLPGPAVNFRLHKDVLSEPTPDMLKSSQEKDEAGREVYELSSSKTSLIHLNFEDGFHQYVLSEITAAVNKSYIPQAKTISAVCRQILLKAKTRLECNTAGNVLMRILTAHPPVTRSLQSVYVRALAGDTWEGNTSQDWNLLKGCINGCLSDDELSRYNNLILFRFISHLLQVNFNHFMLKRQGQYPFRHMLIRMFMAPSFFVTFNQKCRELVEQVGKVVLACVHECTTEKRDQLLEVLEGVLGLVAMVAETCRIQATRGNEPTGSTAHLQLDTVSVFVNELGISLSGLMTELTDVSLLQLVVSSLQFPWLQTGVCQQVLDRLDDFLLTDEDVDPQSQISLSRIVSHYMFLLPLFENGHRRVNDKNTDKSARQRELDCQKAMKRNPKGETPLHVACMKNDVTEVKRLLHMPGVDVNAVDFAGWTPLHEAANHGHLECVKELLNFVPSRAAGSGAAGSDQATSRRVDMLAANTEGITPLHDAVLNNRADVCRLLIEHGGQKLLQAKTCYGYVPQDLAMTEEMTAVLNSLMQDNKGPVEGCSSYAIDFPSPSEDRYCSVLYSNDSRVYTNHDFLLQYILLLTELVSRYLSANNFLASKLCLGLLSSPCDICTKERRKFKSENGCDMSGQGEYSSGERGETSSVCQCVRTDENWNASQEKLKMLDGDLECIAEEEIPTERNQCDLMVLKNFDKFVNRFYMHVKLLSHPDQLEKVHEELQTLYILADYIGKSVGPPV